MALNCGIVGLPNVGKSTLFSALTKNQADIQNYPFCTINPNVGLVEVPDDRLDKIQNIIETQKVIPAVVEFVDIAGLVKGASQGEGLGNQFLGNIRSTGMIAHVVRCFDDGDITHVEGSTNPLRDIGIIETELCLSDLEVVSNKLTRLAKAKRAASGKDLLEIDSLVSLLNKIYAKLEEEVPVRLMGLEKEERDLIKDLGLLTEKEVLYVCNIHEDDLGKDDNDYVKKVKELALTQGAECIVLSAKIEHELSLMDEEDRIEFQKELGMEESGLSLLIRSGYRLLGLKTYFTAGEKEVRAWTFKSGDKAPKAAGVIHTDFEKGFIRAEVYSCNDLFEYKSVQAIKNAGKLRIEGKDYIVEDGDVMLFRFNL